MTDRHPGEATIRAASDGQIELPPPRLTSRACTAARTRASRPVADRGSHHGSPRSPSATLASCTRRRASASASGSSAEARTARRAAISSVTSSLRRGSGIPGSVARHRRPSTTMWCPSGVCATSEVAISAGSVDAVQQRRAETGDPVRPLESKGERGCHREVATQRSTRSGVGRLVSCDFGHEGLRQPCLNRQPSTVSGVDETERHRIGSRS